MVDAIKLLRKLRKPLVLEADDAQSTATQTSSYQKVGHQTLVTRDITFFSSLGRCHPQPVNISLLEDPSGSFSAGTGATTWDSSIALVEYLIEKEIIVHGKDAHTIFPSSLFEGAKVLELGAGLGLPSMVLGKLGFHITASERSIMLPLLKMNIEHNHLGVAEGSTVEVSNIAADRTPRMNPSSYHLNSSEIPERSDCDRAPEMVRIKMLDWMDCDLTNLQQGEYDVIMGADLIFPANRECWDRLADIFLTLLLPASDDDKQYDALPSTESISDNSHPFTTQAPERELSTAAVQMHPDAVGEIDSSITSTSRSPQWCRNMDRNSSNRRRVAFLAFERREGADMVFHTFFETMLLQERGIGFERVFIDRTPSDIHIFKLHYVAVDAQLGSANKKRSTDAAS
jgi:hypothetical protein